ncbi:DUF2231 domain-containing protein [Demequina lutea]|uniref:DUF2231 domain-containing protein n=1 Tax=Demequina lutea TaxID=431489 RepID=A0A7Z0CK15_9MICO|nr:DUF2231 domain-containing protein [Demequina lutea]NYI41443.1 hypothetical protein [Demequina lutea]
MSWTFNGLPLHPLLVHAVVMLAPSASIAAILGTVWPAARRKLGIVTPILTLAAAASAAIAMQAGEYLHAHVTDTKLIDAHIHGAQAVPPWMIFMVAAVWGQWYWFRYQAKRAAAGQAPALSALLSRATTWALGALVIVASVGATTIIALVGDAGARAVWESTFH